LTPKAYEQQLANGAKMMVSMAGAEYCRDWKNIFKLFVNKVHIFLVQVPILKKTL
jgi:hypothetical protein